MHSLNPNSRFRLTKKTERSHGKTLNFSYESYAGVPIPNEFLQSKNVAWEALKPLANVNQHLFEAAVVSYKRNNGKEKNLLRIPFLNYKGPDIDDIWTLAHFDTILVVDTNTDLTANGSLRSISCAARLNRVGGSFHEVWKDHMDYNPSEVLERYDFQGNFDQKFGRSDVAKPAEKFGIIKLLEFFKHDPSLGEAAIVADSDMGLFPAYNQRILPLLEDEPPLPTGFTMIYASADATSAHLLCKLIGEQDSRAKGLFKKSKPSIFRTVDQSNPSLANKTRQ